MTGVYHGRHVAGQMEDPISVVILAGNEVSVIGPTLNATEQVMADRDRKGQIVPLAGITTDGMSEEVLPHPSVRLIQQPAKWALDGLTNCLSDQETSDQPPGCSKLPASPFHSGDIQGSLYHGPNASR